MTYVSAMTRVKACKRLKCLSGAWKKRRGVITSRSLVTRIPRLMAAGLREVGKGREESLKLAYVARLSFRID
jgi:hypothetical protein